MVAASKTTPLYQQVFEEIKNEIEEGRYQPNDRIPSEPELAEKYGVSRITVRRAVEELCSEGRLVKRQGCGTFVSKPHIDRKLLQYAEVRSFTQLCGDNGMEPGAHVLNKLIVPARAEEIEFFGLGEGALLLYIQRVRTADGLPVFEENMYLPYKGYESLMTVDLEDVSLFDIIADLGGARPTTTSMRVVEAVRATAEQSSRLLMGAGDPLLYFKVHFGDEAGRPVCMGRHYYVGSRYRFVL